MMLSPALIKKLITDLKLITHDEDRFKQLVDGLCNTINDNDLDGHFDSLAFVWGNLPQWARALLLAVAYREDKAAFTGITPLTTLEQLNHQQRAIFAQACDKLLTAAVTLIADYHFTDEFYQGWLKARRAAVAEQHTLITRNTINGNGINPHTDV